MKRIIFFIIFVILLSFVVISYLDRKRIYNIQNVISNNLGKDYYDNLEFLVYRSSYFGAAGMKEVFVYINHGVDNKFKKYSFQAEERRYIVKSFDDYVIIELYID